VRAKSRCEFCNVDFQTEFDRSVEARFTVNPSIRSAPDRLYCVGGPGKTPHIVAQLRLDAQQTRTLALQLKAGRYRLRGAQVAQAMVLNVSGDAPGSGANKVSVDEKGFTPSVLTVLPGAVKIELTSAAREHLDLKVEHMEWEDRAATGVMVSSMPEFFDLANKEALVPDEELAVKSVALLFSDLRGSTALYRQLGDAGAYALVREHFAVMREVIARCNGGIVKTIGDAVMAVFLTAPEALGCCFEIQKAFVELWERRPQMATIVVKLGFHCAPCIAVNLNDRLDYFGTAVNIAARVQNESTGGDIVLLESLFNEPEIRAVLDRYKFSVEHFSAELKGIEGQTRLVRLDPDWGGKHLPHGTSVIVRHGSGNMPVNVTSPAP